MLAILNIIVVYIVYTILFVCVFLICKIEIEPYIQAGQLVKKGTKNQSRVKCL